MVICFFVINLIVLHKQPSNGFGKIKARKIVKFALLFIIICGKIST